MDLPYDATLQTFALAALGAFCLGISKTGFPGLAILNVLIVAELFGAKNSVGVILPMLIVCDLLVYPLFRKHASWKQVWPLVPVTKLCPQNSRPSPPMGFSNPTRLTAATKQPLATA